jgi:hypothetical protein
LSEYLDRCRDQRLVLIVAPTVEVEPATCTCGVCEFVMNEAGECPWSKLAVESRPEEVNDSGYDFLQEIREIVNGVDRAERGSTA